MPFTNVQTANVAGGLQLTYGDWTFTESAVSESLALKGGRVYLAVFTSEDSTGALDFGKVRYTASTSGAVTTLTIFGKEGVTTGRFVVLHK